MNHAELDAALAAGRIDRRYEQRLRGCLREVERFAGDRLLREIIERARVVQHPVLEQDPPAVLRSLQSIPGAEHRPGMVELFRAVHRGAMRNTTDASELEKVDTFEQLHAMARVVTQPALATAIRSIWGAMQVWFDRGSIVIPDGKKALLAPPHARRVDVDGSALRMLPISTEFPRLFESESPAVTLALLKRSVERMGRHFTLVWSRSPAAREEDILQADRQLRLLRNVGLVEVICNGFASGASDVLNPLHNLALDVIERHGPAALTEEMQETITRHHQDFSVFLATFSLPCLAVLEDLLREPAATVTQQLLRRWTRQMPDFGGKGFALDCLYYRRYFSVRYLDDGTTTGGPLIDFDRQAVQETEIEQMQSRLVRLGCPSLGTPHRMFTRALCNAYFASVLPNL